MDNELFEKRMQLFRKMCQPSGLMPEILFARGKFANGPEFLTIVAGPTLSADHIRMMRLAIDAIEKGRGL